MISEAREDILNRQTLKEYFREPERVQELHSLLIDRLLSVAQQERSFLAGLLHDDALQLGYQIERLLSEMLIQAKRLPQMHLSLVEVTALTQRLLGRLQGVITELYPPPLEIVSLPQALRTLLQSLVRRTGQSYTLKSDEFSEQGESEQRALLYMIAREALLNVANHAQATVCEVTLRASAEEFYLSVQDNGRGFQVPSAGELLARGHLGLLLIRERARQLQGTWQLDSTPGRGTTLTIHIPQAQHSSGLYHHSRPSAS